MTTTSTVPIKRFIFVLIAVTLALTACGHSGHPGSEKGEDGVGEIVELLMQGIANRDGARVCSLLDVPSMRHVETTQKVDSCPVAVQNKIEELSQSELGTATAKSSWSIELESDVKATVHGAGGAMLAKVLAQDAVRLQWFDESQDGPGGWIVILGK